MYKMSIASRWSDASLSGVEVLLKPENTHHREKYHCMTDLLFDWFGFDQISKANPNSTNLSKKSIS